MERLGLIQPKKVREDECAGLELFTFHEVGNPIDADSDDDRNRLRRLIEARLDALRTRPPKSVIDGASFTPLVDEDFVKRKPKGKLPIEGAANAIADEIWSSAAQNPMLASHIFRQYWVRLERIRFSCPELMTPLLIVQEEFLFPDAGNGAEKLVIEVPIYSELAQPAMMQKNPPPDMIPDDVPALGTIGGVGTQFGAPQMPAQYSAQPAAPAKSPAISADMLEVRLVSIREMLKHYFREFPKDYAKALSSALGLVADESGDAEFLEQRVAFEVARVGSWALSLRVLEELKKQRKKGEEGDGPDPWRMGLKVGRAKAKPWAYYRGRKKIGGQTNEDAAMFCPRWGGFGWSIAVGMLASLLSRD